VRTNAGKGEKTNINPRKKRERNKTPDYQLFKNESIITVPDEPKLRELITCRVTIKHGREVHRNWYLIETEIYAKIYYMTFENCQKEV
jgi:hypothetical protein